MSYWEIGFPVKKKGKEVAVVQLIMIGKKPIQEHSTVLKMHFIMKNCLKQASTQGEKK